MAITLTVPELATACRVGDSTDETAQLTRLLAVASALVLKNSPDAPDDIQNEAVIRVTGYLWDQPGASPGTSYNNAMRNSGALSLLLPWRVHRAGSTAPGAS